MQLCWILFILDEPQLRGAHRARHDRCANHCGDLPGCERRATKDGNVDGHISAVFPLHGVLLDRDGRFNHERLPVLHPRTGGSAHREEPPNTVRHQRKVAAPATATLQPYSRTQCLLGLLAAPT
jgi:hypothetical protein